jgi:hypothetical protein
VQRLLFLLFTLGDTHYVGLLWTRDRLFVETSTWQHTTLTTEIHPRFRRDSSPQSHEATGRKTTWIGSYLFALLFFLTYSLIISVSNQLIKSVEGNNGWEAHSRSTTRQISLLFFVTRKLSVYRCVVYRYSVLWIVTPHSEVNRFNVWRNQTFCIHLPSLYSVDGGNKFLRNFGPYLPNHTLLRFRRQWSSPLLLYQYEFSTESYPNPIQSDPYNHSFS